LAEYLHVESIEPALQTQSKLAHWLYKVHNLVNGKLRKQNLLQESNPSFASVKKVYEERVKEGCVRTAFEGWDFLFSIAENHPYSLELHDRERTNPLLHEVLESCRTCVAV
jgi:hypothetical protein